MAARQRILVVDDEPQICDVVELYLRREGFEVETANDVRLRSKRWNLIRRI